MTVELQSSRCVPLRSQFCQILGAVGAVKQNWQAFEFAWEDLRIACHVVFFVALNLLRQLCGTKWWAMVEFAAV